MINSPQKVGKKLANVVLQEVNTQRSRKSSTTLVGTVPRIVSKKYIKITSR